MSTAAQVWVALQVVTLRGVATPEQGRVQQMRQRLSERVAMSSASRQKHTEAMREQVRCPSLVATCRLHVLLSSAHVHAAQLPTVLAERAQGLSVSNLVCWPR